MVVSGAEDELGRIELACAEHGWKTRWLRVSHAFHSPLMEPMLAEFHSVAQGLSFHAPRIPVVSAMTGRRVESQLLGSPRYWVEHVRRPVRFHDSVAELYDSGVRTFLELGPDAILTAMTQQALGEAAEPPFTASLLRRERNEVATALAAVAAADARGIAVDWPATFSGTTVGRTKLPTYAFDHRRYWPAAQTPPAGPASG